MSLGVDAGCVQSSVVQRQILIEIIMQHLRGFLLLAGIIVREVSSFGIPITGTPEPSSVCVGQPLSLTWNYNGEGKVFHEIYWRFTSAATKLTEVIVEYLLGANVKFTPLNSFRDRLQPITTVPQPVKDGAITLNINETKVQDSGEIKMYITDNYGKLTVSGALLSIKTAPTLKDGETTLGIERNPHNLTTALIHCTNLKTLGNPAVNVSVMASVPGRPDVVHEVEVINGEGKKAFYGQERFGTFTCNVVGPAAACLASPVSKSLEWFTDPGTPKVLAVEADDDQASIRFKAGFSGGTAVQYSAEYQKLNETNWSKAQNIVSQVAEDEEGEMLITDLQPQTSYSVRIVATNSKSQRYSMPKNFTTLDSKDDHSSADDLSEDDQSSGLSQTAIIGIIAGCVALLVIIGAVLVYRRHKGKRGKGKPHELEKLNEGPSKV